MKKHILILALVLLIVPITAFGGDTSILVGAQTVSFGADLGKYYDIPPGPGFTLLVGFDLGVPLDFRFGRRSAEEGNTDRDVAYQWIELGPRFTLGVENTTIVPDWFCGIGSYDLEIGNLSFDTALGVYVGFGIEETLSDKYVGRVEVKSVMWKSETFSTDAPSLNLSLLFGIKL